MQKKLSITNLAVTILGGIALLITNTNSSGAAAGGDMNDDFGITKWKDGKKAVFMLEFDDSCVSHVKTAIPELVKRSMVGTFYINPGNGPYQSQKEAWEKKIPKMEGIVYANHTYKHKGAPSVEVLDEELALCNEAINKCFPNMKQPRLISFGQPGGVPWEISNEEKNKLLAKYNLIDRPPFFGYPFHLKTREDVLKLVDTAIEKGEMRHIDFHGVGADWHVTPTDIYIDLLDKLEANRDIVWITDPVSYHQYLTERNASELTVESKTANSVTFNLVCKTDSELYDLPLTIYAKIPAKWKSFTVTQNGAKVSSSISDGKLLFDVAPVNSKIVIKRQ
ncbi:MAG: polysaccharide deacetylase family protein [Lentisphaerae bacterium]|jgi:hypothetical protein|nr:polysaccharide deacetylase family protein [Lentisphaerota bacterium]